MDNTKLFGDTYIFINISDSHMFPQLPIIYIHIILRSFERIVLKTLNLNRQYIIINKLFNLK